MSNPLANCKTYVEGRGWVNNWGLKSEPVQKTVSDIIEDIFGFSVRARVAKAKENDTNEIRIGVIAKEEIEYGRMRAKYN